MSSHKVNHLGGHMYGDGEYVVDFENVGSTQAPLVATVLSPTGHGYTLDVRGLNPNVEAARIIIGWVRADERQS
jgi:hypothetical protein